MTILATRTTVGADGNVRVYVGKEWAGIEVSVTITPVMEESIVDDAHNGRADTRSAGERPPISDNGNLTTSEQ